MVQIPSVRSPPEWHVEYLIDWSMTAVDRATMDHPPEAEPRD